MKQLRVIESNMKVDANLSFQINISTLKVPVPRSAVSTSRLTVEDHFGLAID